MNEPRIRRLQPGDEEAVRHICFETALAGRPMKPFLDDVVLVSEALIGYYLRHEPELFFVADIDGRVGGYATGSADTARFEQGYRRRVVPRLLQRFVLRGHVARRAAWTLLLWSLRNAFHEEHVRRTLFSHYPAHLHVNLDATCRGRGVGSALVRYFLDEVAGQDVRGVHLSVRTEGGLHFFERMGFRVLARYQVTRLFDVPAGAAWIMGRALHPLPDAASRERPDAVTQATPTRGL